MRRDIEDSKGFESLGICIYIIFKLQVGLSTALHAAAPPLWLPYTTLDNLLLELSEVQHNLQYRKVSGSVMFQIDIRSSSTCLCERERERESNGVLSTLQLWEDLVQKLEVYKKELVQVSHNRAVFHQG